MIRIPPATEPSAIPTIDAVDSFELGICVAIAVEPPA